MKVPAPISYPLSRSDDAQAGESERDRLYRLVSQEFGQALARLARGYEPDPHRWRDLLQTIHLEVWRSLATFDSRCSLRTWVYRVAHNTALKVVARAHRRRALIAVSLDDIAEIADDASPETQIDQERTGDRLAALISRLKPLDQQIILLYLEDLSAQDIAQLSGLSSAHVATKIHRIKHLLANLFRAGAVHD